MSDDADGAAYIAAMRRGDYMGALGIAQERLEMSDDKNEVGTFAWAMNQIDESRRKAAEQEAAAEEAPPEDEFGSPEEMRAEIIRLRDEVADLTNRLDELQESVNKLYRGNGDW